MVSYGGGSLVVLADDRRLHKKTMETILYMDECLPPGLHHFVCGELRSQDRLIVVTRSANFIEPPSLDGYLGLTRTYGRSAVVEAPKHPGVIGDHALIAHELVHAVGGNEIDAEYVELKVASLLGQPWQQSEGELRAWAAEGQSGNFVSLSALIDLYESITGRCVV